MINLFENCNESGIDCFLTLIPCSLSLVGLILCSTCIVKIWHQQHRKVFELLPLSSAAILSVLQFIQNFIVQDIRFLLSSQFVEVIAFAFVALSFAMLYFRIRHIEQGHLEEHPLIQNQKIIKSVFVIFSVMLLAVYIITLVTISPDDCNDWFGKKYFIPLGCTAFSSLIGIIFGLLLRNKIIKQENDSLLDTTESDYNPDMVVFTKLNHHQMLRRQVRSILLMYACITAAQIALNIVRGEAVINDISCLSNHVFQANEIGSQAFIFLFSLVEITPCFVFPYVYYYVPFAKRKFLQHQSADLVLKLNEEEILHSNHSSFSHSSEINDVVFHNNFEEKQKKGVKKNEESHHRQDGQYSQDFNEGTVYQQPKGNVGTQSQDDWNKPIDNDQIIRPSDLWGRDQGMNWSAHTNNNNHSSTDFEENYTQNRKTTIGQMAQGFQFNFSNIQRTETKEEGYELNSSKK